MTTKIALTIAPDQIDAALTRRAKRRAAGQLEIEL